MTSRHHTTSNQHWNNAVYVNVEQRRINVVHFNVDLNNVRQRRNNVAIFNLDFHNVGQRWNNVVNMKIWKKKKKKLSLDSKVKWYFWASNNTLDSKCSSFYCPFSEEYVKEDLQGRKILKTWNILNYKNYKPSHFVKYQLVFNLTRRQVQTS